MLQSQILQNINDVFFLYFWCMFDVHSRRTGWTDLVEIL